MTQSTSLYGRCKASSIRFAANAKIPLMRAVTVQTSTPPHVLDVMR